MGIGKTSNLYGSFSPEALCFWKTEEIDSRVRKVKITGN